MFLNNLVNRPDSPTRGLPPTIGGYGHQPIFDIPRPPMFNFLNVAKSASEVPEPSHTPDRDESEGKQSEALIYLQYRLQKLLLGWSNLSSTSSMPDLVDSVLEPGEIKTDSASEGIVPLLKSFEKDVDTSFEV
jgi:hypothetical protein